MSAEWIKCSDKMPDLRKKDLLITFQILKHIETEALIPHVSVDLPETLYKIGNKLYSEQAESEITHWMPLPNPPKDDLIYVC